MSRHLGCHRISLVRTLLVAVFGASAWLLWLAGTSQAADLLSAIPPVPSPSDSPAPVQLPGPIAPLVNQLTSTVPAPSQLAAVPGTLVGQITEKVLAPVVGAVDAVPPTVTDTIGKLPALPELPMAPAAPLPSAPAVPAPPSVPAVPEVPVVSRTLLPEEPQAPAPERAAPVTAAIQSGPGAIGTNSGFIPAGVVFVPPAVLAATAASSAPAGPPPEAQIPAAVSPPGAGSTSDPEGSSFFGTADLPEQRALGPPPRNGTIPDPGQSPSAEPLFDPGSSPD